MPDKPLLPTRIASSKTSITAGWEAPDNNGDSITSYRLYQSVAGGNYNLVFEGLALSYAVQGLATGTEYRYKVSAVNNAGESEHSDILFIIASGTPSKPRQVEFSYNSRSGTTISWLPPEDDGGAPIVEYRVSYALNNPALPIDRLAWSGASTETDFLTFSSGNSYKFQVSALNSVSKQFNALGELSDIGYWDAAVTSSPPVLSVLDSSVGWIEFQWLPPQDLGGSAIIAYNLYIDDGYGGALNLVYSGLATSKKVEGLATGYTYRVQLRAENVVGESEPSELTSLTCDTPPAVHNFQVLTRNAMRTQFSWEKPLFATHCPILGYIINAGTTSNSLFPIGSTDSEAVTYFDYEHPSATDQDMYYMVSVKNWKTQNSATAGTPSNTIYAITAGAPGPVTNVGNSNVGINQITLTWDAPASTGGSAVLEYYIYINDGMGGDLFSDGSFLKNTQFTASLSRNNCNLRNSGTGNFT